MSLLPIEAYLPTIVETLRAAGRLVLQAAPGAGKTTRAPAAFLEAGLAGAGDIVVVVPRRLAARMAARFVAQARGETVGQTIGYTVRFDDRTGPATRLRFVTDGLLTRRLLADPTLRGTGLVVIDEFHERHLSTDLALARIRQLQLQSRPDLKLVVMSATLDAERVAAFLDQAPVIAVPGRTFPVVIEHAPAESSAPLSHRVAAAVERFARETSDGDMLVFLPGMADIRAGLRACAPVAARHDLALHALHAALPAAEQDAATQPSARRKVVLATNVAESAITIENIAVVIDSGLVRRVEHSPWTGFPQATTGRVAQASAVQRAGRAGRTRPGHCLRLYTEADFNLRPAFETPEIHRTDLAEAVLELRAAGVHDWPAFPWFESPGEAALGLAEQVLHRLGALEGNALTPIGRAMLALPTTPRLARLIVEGKRYGIEVEACRVAALLGERDVRAAPTPQGGYGESDVLALLDTFETANDPATVARVRRAERQLVGLARRLPPLPRSDRPAQSDRDTLLERCLLVAFPDRVGRLRRRVEGEREMVLPSGGQARLAPSSVVTTAELALALDAETQADGTTLIRLASRIESDWLLELFFDAIEETDTHELRADGRIVRRRRLRYDGVLLEEQVLPTVEPETAARLLVEHLRADARQADAIGRALERLQARLAFVAAQVPEAGLKPFTDDAVWAAAATLCLGCRTVEEVRRVLLARGLAEHLLMQLTPAQRQQLDRLAPESLPFGRRRTSIVYPTDGQLPYVAAPIQDFFGLVETPRIAGGRMPLTLHLLAPNRRPIQVTTDLGGFWKRAYRELRPQLARRYPKHAFPEIGDDGQPRPR
ncbi:MAG: ATP-dependent helicase HrpB [Chloracidobacterium sp.]